MNEKYAFRLPDQIVCDFTSDFMTNTFGSIKILFVLHLRVHPICHVYPTSRMLQEYDRPVTVRLHLSDAAGHRNKSALLHMPAQGASDMFSGHAILLKLKLARAVRAGIDQAEPVGR